MILMVKMLSLTHGSEFPLFVGLLISLINTAMQLKVFVTFTLTARWMFLWYIIICPCVKCSLLLPCLLLGS